MIAIHILIPERDNEGAAFSQQEFRVFEDLLIQLFTGFSRLPDTIRGSWSDGGHVYHDTSIVYVVAVPGLLESGHRIRLAVDFAKSLFQQEAIGLRYLGHFEAL